jgi:hypothetical protein
MKICITVVTIENCVCSAHIQDLFIIKFIFEMMYLFPFNVKQFVMKLETKLKSCREQNHVKLICFLLILDIKSLLNNHSKRGNRAVELLQHGWVCVCNLSPRFS